MGRVQQLDEKLRKAREARLEAAAQLPPVQLARQEARWRLELVTLAEKACDAEVRAAFLRGSTQALGGARPLPEACAREGRGGEGREPKAAPSSPGSLPPLTPSVTSALCVVLMIAGTCDVMPGGEAGRTAGSAVIVLLFLDKQCLISSARG
jgi:hypothetical protein